MRLACSTASLFALPLHDVFPVLADVGFRSAEIMVTRDPSTQDPHLLSRLADAHGISISAIHAPLLLMSRTVWGTDPVVKIYRSIELAEAVGAPLVVVHPPFRWQSGYRRWLDDQMPRLADRTGVRVAVENMFPVKVRGRTVASPHTVRTVEALEGFPHVVFDTSHAAVSDLNLLETLEQLRGRLAHVHLSNNAGRGWDSHLPVHEGVLDLGPFLEALAADGFDGSVSLELDLRSYLSDPARLREVLAGNLRFCQERLAGSDWAETPPKNLAPHRNGSPARGV
jgi:sugar phosphate isomerase/epimerase